MKKMLLMVAVVATVGLTSCGGADMCECMDQKEADMTDECKKLKEETMKKYEEADADGKKKMDEEMEACSKDEKKDEEK